MWYIFLQNRLKQLPALRPMDTTRHAMALVCLLALLLAATAAKTTSAQLRHAGWGYVQPRPGVCSASSYILIILAPISSFGDR